MFPMAESMSKLQFDKITNPKPKLMGTVNENKFPVTHQKNDLKPNLSSLLVYCCTADCVRSCVALSVNCVPSAKILQIID